MEKQYFSLFQPNHDPVDWDFADYHPDLIVVNLGTNDSHLEVPADLFREHYSKFIIKLRHLYPTTPIAVMRILAGYYEQDIQAMVAALQYSGDKQLYYIDTTDWITVGTDDLADKVHPSEKGHEKIAARLAPILKKILEKK